jgi:sarcosine oxidase
MGSATAWEATRRGLETVILEQFELGHPHGSSHGSARIVRRAYPDELFVQLTGLAFERWSELEADSGVRLVRLTGGLDYGAHRDVRLVAEALSAQGVAHELMDATEATTRWPGIAFDGPVLHHPQAGTVDADGAVAAALRCSTERGAAVLPGVTVQSVSVDGDDAVVVTSGGPIRARRVVLAAGAWMGRLTDGVVPMPALTVTQQQVFHFRHQDPAVEWPVVLHRDAVDVYHLPGGRDGGASGGRKVAEHTGSPTTPERRSGVVDDVARERIVDYVSRTLPGLAPEPYNESTCLYTRTANEDFVIDRLGPVVVASPCSGHGAKFAPLVGSMVTDLVTGAARPEPRFTVAAHRG